ncbi:MAG: hypothetical protein HY982_02735 [Candidatus Magasanikbacteria bacterium]|nr:hypothetical protein [Candidatus Magasanikbacteria bacterium]
MTKQGPFPLDLNEKEKGAYQLLREAMDGYTEAVWSTLDSDAVKSREAEKQRAIAEVSKSLAGATHFGNKEGIAPSDLPYFIMRRITLEAPEHSGGYRGILKSAMFLELEEVRREQRGALRQYREDNRDPDAPDSKILRACQRNISGHIEVLNQAIDEANAGKLTVSPMYLGGQIAEFLRKRDILSPNAEERIRKRYGELLKEEETRKVLRRLDSISW